MDKMELLNIIECWVSHAMTENSTDRIINKDALMGYIMEARSILLGNIAGSANICDANLPVWMVHTRKQ